MNKLRKKGFIAGIMVDFYAYLAFVLIILIFFILFAFAKKDIMDSATYDIEDTSSNLALTNYLRTPVLGGDNIADIISKYYIAKNINNNPELAAYYDNLLKETTQDIFSEFSDIRAIGIVFDSENIQIYQGEKSEEYGDVSTIIPIHGVRDGWIVVNLKKGLGVW